MSSVYMCHNFQFHGQKLTEGRLLFFNHEVAPNYLRTKLEPEVEEKTQQLVAKAQQTTQEQAQVGWVVFHSLYNEQGLANPLVRS